MAEGRIRLTGEDASAAVVARVKQSVGELTGELYKADKAVEDLKKELAEAVNSGQQGVIAAVSAQLDEAIPKLQQVERELKDAMKPAVDDNAQSFQFLADAIKNPAGAAVDLAGTLRSSVVAAGGETAIAILGMSAAAVAGGAALVSLRSEARETSSELQDLHAITGTSVPSLSNLKFAVEAVGGSFGDTNRMLFDFDKRIEMSSDKVESGLKRVGLSLADVEAMPADQRLLAISDAMRAAGDDTNLAATAVEILGGKGRDFLPLLLKPLRELTEEGQRFGVTMDAEAVAGADDFNDSLQKMRAEASATWAQLGLHVSMADAVSYAYERMKLAVANVAYTTASAVTGLATLNQYLPAIWQQIRGTVDKIPEVAGEAKKSVDAVKKAAQDLALQPITLSSDEAKREAADLEASAKKLIATRQKDSAEADRQRAFYDNLNSSMMDLSGAQVEAIRYYDQQHKSVGDITKALGVYEQQVQQVVQADRAEVAALDAQIKSWNSYNAQLERAIHLKSNRGLALPGAGEMLDVPAKPDMGGLGDAVKAANKAHAASMMQVFGSEIQDYFAKGGFTSRIVQGLTGGGGMRGAVSGAGAEIGGLFTQHLGESASKLIGGTLGSVMSGVIGPLGALVGPLIDKLFSIGGPSKQEKEGRSVVADFEKQFGSTTEMINKVGEAYRANGKSAEEAQAAIQRLWAAEKQGAEATKAALAAITAELQHQSDVSNVIAGHGFQSHDELMKQADLEREAYEQMAKSSQYTQEQVNEQYLNFQKALAAAGDAAAQAWLKAHDAAGDMASRTNTALSALQTQWQNLSKSIEGEAPEPDMGAIERATREQMADLEKQIEAQKQAQADAAADASVYTQETWVHAGDAMAEAMGASAQDAASRVQQAFSGASVTVAVHYAYDSIERPESNGMPSYASEGYDLSRPHAAIVGDAYGDPESVLRASTVREIVRAARNAGASSGAAGVASVTVGNVSVQVFAAPDDDVKSLGDKILRVVRERADVYEAMGTIAVRRIGG